MRFSAGERIDGYEIVSHLGTGGMSEVYLAHSSDQQVVIKIPHPALIGDPASFSRFQREIEIGRRLQHPSIQRLLGVGYLSSGGAPYIITEYVQGESFRVYLDTHKPLALDDATKFARQIAEVLEYCHQQGVIHRDLKPENILVTPRGQVKLMDFGIALLQGARRVTWGSLSSTVGTPDYMAPEQVRGERGDARTDVYAVGVIFYEMVTGEVPFQGDNPLAVMSQRVTSAPRPVRSLRPDVPIPVAAVIERALRREPSDRYPTMAAFIYDLDHPDEVNVTAPSEGSAGLPQAWITVAVIVAVFLSLALIGVGAEMLHHAQTVP